MFARQFGTVIFLFMLLVGAVTAEAQEDPELQLRLSRDFGYGSGTQIQGTFSYRVEAPEGVQRVEFLLDDEVVGEDAEPPFRLRFNTGSYDLGWHTMAAVGYTQDGRVFRSNSVQRQFVSPRQSYTVVIGILALVVGFVVLRYLFTRRAGDEGPKRGYGLLGGAICPRCGRPFAFHVWGVNLMAGRLDRCPHCGKWSFLQRASPQALAQAEAAFDDVEEPAVQGIDEETRRRRRLEESRYEE